MDASTATPQQSPFGAMYAMYEEQIGFIKVKDVAGLLKHYADDCLLISTFTADRQPQYVRGHGQLREFFERRLSGLENLQVTRRQWAETDSTMMTVEAVSFTPSQGSPRIVEMYENWYVRNGRIAIHFAGVLRYPDGTYADGTGFLVGEAPAKQEPPETRLGQMYRQHIGFIQGKDVAGILNQYAEDALVISTLTEGRKPRYVRGRNQLREFFDGNFMGLQHLTSRIDQWAEADNALMIVESIDITQMDGSMAHMSFYDNWVLREGRIGIHFAGVVRYPDGSYA
jgi:ketosteroid isomerase-like protein